MRIAIIGCGRAGQQHVEAIGLAGRESGVTARVVAVVDSDETRAAEFARKTGAAVRTPAQVFDDSEIDAVSLCTPPDVHVEIAIAALRSGKGVVIEKPVARTTDELDTIIAAAAAASLPALAMLQHRGRLPASVLDRTWTEDAFAAIEVIRPRDTRHYQAEAWRHDPDRSLGGQLAHLGVHHLDLACQLLGAPSSVVGMVDCRDSAGIDTRAALAVRFAGGGLMSVMVNAHPAPRSDRLHVVDGERELLVIDAGTEYRDGAAVHLQPTLPTPQLRALVYGELCNALTGAIVSDRYSIARTRGVTAVLEAARRITATEAA
jgi:UDP-N-acetyl-2-amino-2-deoxyglucuronate dehydrogenase